MLQWLRKRWWVVALVAVLVAAGIVLVTYSDQLRPSGDADDAESDLPTAKAEAPPDLQKLRDAYAAGTEALAKDDFDDAVKHLSSFTFGSRAVEEYRLYYLATAYEKANNPTAARTTRATLWRRSPKLQYAAEAGKKLGEQYAAAGDWQRAAAVWSAIPHDSAARWNMVVARMRSGDAAGALFGARSLIIHNPASEQADEAIAFVRAMSGLGPNATVP
ncbi:MAG TPA: hypothetical protein VEU30_05740, partial [Thermoanaerobaculia bacterium]|nr:hypothetical protein [Thermoanaerobaculia bacterium]